MMSDASAVVKNQRPRLNTHHFDVEATLYLSWEDVDKFLEWCQKGNATNPGLLAPVTSPLQRALEQIR